MEIVYLTSGRSVPSSRFRVLQYLPYLRAMGHHCRVYFSWPPKYRGWRLLGNRLSEGPRIAGRCFDILRIALNPPDVVVIERELFSSGFVGLERWLRKLAPALVLDVDDALFVPHPAKFETLVRLADWVIAGNDLLAEHIAPVNSAVTVLPTCLDLRRYRVKPSSHSSEVPVIGWTGMAGNYPYLARLLEPLRAIMATHRCLLRLIAERPPEGQLDLSGLDWQFVPWSEATEIEDLQQFDIGLMPLDDTEWTRYKCGLKILQYMALGLPAVASPVGVSTDIIEDGRNGFLARSPGEWREAIEQLLANPARRREMGQAGRETIAASYSIETHAPQLADILQQAVIHSERRRGPKRNEADEPPR